MDASGLTIADNRTGLTWQRNVDPGRYTWDQAKTYCQGLSLAPGGWRLPSFKELLTLVDPTKASPAIDSDAFPATPAGPIEDASWSSTPVAGQTGRAWAVNFNGGMGYNPTTATSSLARCVR
jgi:hypothetical protein